MSNERQDRLSILLKRAYDAVLKEPVPDVLTKALNQASRDIAKESGQ